MNGLPKEVQLKCETLLAAPLLHIETVSGGDINEARLLHTPKGSFFLKMNSVAHAAQLFETESKGLQLLGQSKYLYTPNVIAFDNVGSTAFLLMEYVPSGNKTNSFWKHFGSNLALLHNNSTHTSFGLDHNNFIGRLPQSNTFESTWPGFYSNQRLLPQIKLAVNSKLISTSDSNLFEQLFTKLDSICPTESPTLIHGDLWCGNFLANQSEGAVLIDPSVSYAHREMDLAMSHLFGGFSPLFYRSYNETYPLEKGFEDRMDIYQLYYLLAHVNLFGGSYVRSAMNIAKRYS